LEEAVKIRFSRVLWGVELVALAAAGVAAWKYRRLSRRVMSNAVRSFSDGYWLRTNPIDYA
jgi:hypothetical protein